MLFNASLLLEDEAIINFIQVSMKKKNLFMALTAICAGFTFASCSNDIDDVASSGHFADPTRGVTMDITKVATSEMTNVTRATPNEVETWATAPDKNIGISVYSSVDGTEAMKPGSVNMKWTYNTASSGWDAQTPLTMFPGDEGVVTAYYPYGEGIDPKAIDIDGTKDYMYALIGDNKTINYGTPQTSLLMHHTNAQIRVNLVRDGYAGPGEVTAFSVKGTTLASKAKLNALTGEFSDYTTIAELAGRTGTLAADINTNPTAKINTVYEWFVPVVETSAPIAFYATVDGLKLRYIMDDIQFEPGERYTFNLAVTGDLAGNLVMNTFEVTPWTDGDEVNEELELYDDPYNGHEYVDLGLPSGLKWAKCNVGADEETAPGLYFAWRDIEGHEKDSGYEFTSANYTAKGLSYANGVLTAYEIALAEDAARVNLGGNWRMPTKAEFEELYNNTNVTWATITGVAGRKFTNKVDASKYIFMPITGQYRGTILAYINERGYYWSSTHYGSSEAYNLSFGKDSQGMYETYPYYGSTVRAVCE